MNENEKRTKKGDKDFDRMFQLANDLAIAMNPQRWFNLAEPERADYIPDLERRVIISKIKSELQAEIDKEEPLPPELEAFIKGLLGH